MSEKPVTSDTENICTNLEEDPRGVTESEPKIPVETTVLFAGEQDDGWEWDEWDWDEEFCEFSDEEASNDWEVE